MKKETLSIRSILICLVLFFCGSCVLAGDSEVPKLCWAHYVAWGFDHVGKYDRWAVTPELPDPLTDRSLLGRNIQWDSGVCEGTRRQIDTARFWGFDGFTVDVVNVEAFSNIMERFYRAAEGTNFKISLCIDNHRDISVETMTEHLGAFIEKYQKHPNSFLIDGRMMIFAYSLGMPPSDWREVRQRLRTRNLDAYYVDRMISEGAMSGDPAALAERLRGCEGIYDFGCNGFTPRDMAARLKSARAALEKNRPDGILVAGIAPGYLGQSTGFYRPFLNSGSLRGNWEAALEVGANQVCITTWNDYVEHTHFEPSVVNRTALLRINQEYIARWRGEPTPPRPSQVIFSYMEEVLYGNDLTFEVLNFSYTEPEEKVYVRFLDETGSVIRDFPPLALDRDKLTATTLRLTDEDLQNHSLIRVQASVLREGEEEPVFRELCPISRRYGKAETYRTVRIPYAEISHIPLTLEISQKTESAPPTARVVLKTWTAAGRVEILRNGFPVAETEISHLKAPYCVLEFPLPERNRALKDVYAARFTNSSDGVGWSNAVTRTVFPQSEVRPQPVLVTGSDFDENWPIWSQRISRLPEPAVAIREIPANDVFFVHYRFTRKAGSVFFPEEGWNLPLRLVGGGGKPDPKPAPDSKPQSAPDSVQSSDGAALVFTGRESYALPSRTFPADAFTLEMVLRPAENPSEPAIEQVLFSDGTCDLRLDANLRPVLKSHRVTLTSSTSLVPGRKVRVTVVNDLENVILRLDGEEVARQPSPRIRRAINSVPVLGTNFVGELFDLYLQAGLRE